MSGNKKSRFIVPASGHIILSLLRDGTEKYGMQLVKESEGGLQLSSVYTYLGRLSERNLVTSRQSGPVPGCAPLRFYTITERGLAALELADKVHQLLCSEAKPQEPMQNEEKTEDSEEPVVKVENHMGASHIELAGQLAKALGDRYNLAYTELYTTNGSRTYSLTLLETVDYSTCEAARGEGKSVQEAWSKLITSLIQQALTRKQHAAVEVVLRQHFGKRNVDLLVERALAGDESQGSDQKATS